MWGFHWKEYLGQKGRFKDGRAIRTASSQRKWESRSYDGLVYNLHTENNVYSVYGVLVHNCIPVAPKYVIEGATIPERLTIFGSAILENEDVSTEFVNSIPESVKSVALLGLSYKEDIKIPVLSPCILLANKLLAKGKTVSVFDTYYTEEEIRHIVSEKVDVVKAFKDINADLVVVLSPHEVIRTRSYTEIRSVLNQNTRIVDETGAWEKFRDLFKQNGITYHRVGDENWLKW
jgi:UDP-N-acetyl-D-mannosaminuronate dehydrogenase